MATSATQTQRSTTGYPGQRLIGLLSRQTIYDGTGTPYARTSYAYDTGSIHVQAQYAVQHDFIYDPNYFARGNLTKIFRWDANDVDNESKRLATELTYDSAGSLLTTTDPAGHQRSLGYGDSFSDGVLHNTFAYPTTMTDADDHSSYVQYNYDFGAQTYTQGPAPEGQSVGARQYYYYDEAARLNQVYNVGSGAVSHIDYGPFYTQTWSSVNAIFDGYAFSYFDGLGRVVAAATQHAETGTYGAQRTEYDYLGRVSRQTNPTEIYANWDTALDDAGGWQFNVPTEYDWKGRPLRTYNMDGTYKAMSYAGCGCAGGEKVTLTDEVERQQVIYSDVLGRQWKTELLTYPDGNNHRDVYATTVNTFNARDQVTLIRQYAGTDQSSTCQDTTMSYDGYGRLQTKHVPEQKVDPNNPSSTDHTTWTYKPDDTIESVTDARGASATYVYNNYRHLVNEIHYSAPSGVTTVKAVANVTFAYDAAGNRTSMIDGSGSTSYGYDSLSRMTSESRTFTGLGGPYTLSYSYNLAGQVTSVTDQHAATSFSTNYDSVGRIGSVTGVGYGGTATQFVSSMSYRASGAAKSVAYGNNTNMTFGYNARGFVTSFTANFPGNGNYFGSAYDYYADGQVKFAQDQSTYPTPIKDRAYNYDHAGRLNEAYSGAQARDFINSTNSGIVDGPYRQSYAYDVWGNQTNESWRLWSRSGSTPSSYNSSNRNIAWSYDADGNLLSRGDGAQYGYDAAGNGVSEAQTITFYDYQDGGSVTNVINNISSYDADGQLVHFTKALSQTFNGNPTGSNTNDVYSLRSTVLGGRVVSEYDGQGVWARSYVYAGGERAGEQTRFGTSPVSNWRYVDPVTGDEGGAVLDPQGVDVGLSDPFPPNGAGDPDGLVNGSDPVKSGSKRPLAMESGGVRCVLDGIEMDCGFIRGWSTQQCPDNDCGPRVGEDGHLTQPFQAFADGGYGFLPQGAIYEGSGRWFIYGGKRDDRGKRRKERPEDGNYGVRRNHATPQNPTPNVDDLENRITKMVSDPDCAKFIRELINGTATAKNPAQFTDALTGFRKIKSQSGFIYGDTIQKAYGFAGGTVNGSIGGGNAQVELPTPAPFPVGLSRRGAAEYVSDRGRIDAEVVLHEILHLAGKNVYDDFVYADTVAKMRGTEAPNFRAMPYKEGVRKASEYWNLALMSACSPKGPRYEK